MSPLRSLWAGFRSVARGSGLVALVLAANLGLGLLLAVPFAIRLDGDLAHSGASRRMASGFDFDWWSRWDEHAAGPAAGMAPDLAGIGFALRNLSDLLAGQFPAGLFAGSPGPDPEILGVGVLYLLLQVYLTGGLLSVFRASQGGFTLAAFLHGCAFYFGRLLRVSLLALLAAGALFAVHAPLTRWTDRLAREAISERTALGWTLGQNLLLLGGLLLLHMVSSYAKVIVVYEERTSAVLAGLSSLGFCARNLLAALAQYVVVIAAGILLLAVFALAQARVGGAGYGTQLVALALVEAFVAARIALRLGLLAGQLELHRARVR